MSSKLEQDLHNLGSNFYSIILNMITELYSTLGKVKYYGMLDILFMETTYIVSKASTYTVLEVCKIYGFTTLTLQITANSYNKQFLCF